MKKLILFCLLITVVYRLQAQNTISIIHHPTDMGFGLRYDKQIKNYGFYISASRGVYKLSDKLKSNHLKLVAGVVKYFPDAYYTDVNSLYSIGISYNRYGNSMNLPDKVFRPLSIDLGVGVRIKKITTGFCFDFLKGEGSVNFGINF